MSKSRSRILPALAACALSTGACSTDGAGTPESTDSGPAATASNSILASSEPANGAKLRSAPQRLVLNFAKPVRLAEVLVTGADGLSMPMMVSPAGANRRYELPLDGLAKGSYTVRWRAIDEGGATHEGTIAFQVG